MAIITQTHTIQSTITIDTDKFTKQEWFQFIKQHVAWERIAKVMKEDIFPLDKLKELAIAGASISIIEYL